jgi:hypothetical protein
MKRITTVFHSHSYSRNDCHKFRNKNILFNVNELKGKEYLLTDYQYSSVMLDSGITGDRVTLQEYIDFIKLYDEYIDIVVNYDIMDDPIVSLQNYEELFFAGIQTMPVYHVLESIEILENYIKKHSHYVGIGGTLKLPKEQIDIFFGDIFNRFPDGCFHGFGCSGELAFKYNFQSVDSSSAIQFRRFLDERKALEVINNLYPDEKLDLFMSHIESKVSGNFYEKKQKKIKPSNQLELFL